MLIPLNYDCNCESTEEKHTADWPSKDNKKKKKSKKSTWLLHLEQKSHSEVQVMVSFSSLYLVATPAKDCLAVIKATEQVRLRSDLYANLSN